MIGYKEFLLTILFFSIIPKDSSFKSKIILFFNKKCKPSSQPVCFLLKVSNIIKNI